jgi:hypothetical protein
MAAISDLTAMLRGVEPVLAPEAYGIVSLAALPAGLVPFATVAEAEGLTVIAGQRALIAAGVAEAEGAARWARISLMLHSDLEALGLTAAFSTALGEKGISANVVAGYFHDHIFVQWDRAEAAMAALRSLADA